MAYLLILPVALHIALAVVVLQRRPRGISSIMLAVYLISAACTTWAYLVLGTTSHETYAKVALLAILILLYLAYYCLLPLTLIALYFETWFRQHWQWLLLVAVASAILVNVWVVREALASEKQLAVQMSTGYWLNWTESPWLESLVTGPFWSRLAHASILLVSQVLTGIVIGVALRQRRVTFWREALPFMVAAILSLFLPVISPLVGKDTALLACGLGYLMPVLMLTRMVIYQGQNMPLREYIESTLSDYSDGVILVNGSGKVVWKNAPVARWLKPGGYGAVAPMYLFELLRGTALAGPIQRMLEMGTTVNECTVTRQDEEYVLQIERHTPDHVRDLSGGHLLVLRDITASRVRRDLHERSQELLALSAISADISASLELDQVIARTLQQVLALTQMEGAALYLVTEHDPSLCVLSGVRFSFSPALEVPKMFPTMGSVPGKAMQERRPMLISNRDLPPAIHNEAFAQRLHNGVIIPLIIRDTVNGVLILGGEMAHDLDTVMMALLESVGRQVAVAVENARLHSQERRQRHIAETLREVASILSTQKLDDALKAMLAQLMAIVEYDRATVLLMDEPGWLRVVAHAGLKIDPDKTPPENARIEIARYLHLQRLFEERIPQIVSDTTVDKSWIDKYGYRSWIGSPLMIHGQVLGCLSIAHDHSGRFTLADLQVANAFADQMVIAVENAQLFESEQRRRIQAELIQKASYDLVTNHDLDSALQAALVNLSKLLPFDHAHIGMIDELDQTWTARANLPPQVNNAPKPPVPVDHYPMVLQLIVQKRPCFIADMTQHPEFKPNDPLYPPGSWLGAPLTVRGKVVGTLNVHCNQPDSFSSEHFQTLQLFANQLAAAVESFRLLDEAGRKNRALGALNTVLAASNEALSQENRLTALLERVLGTLSMNAGTIHRRHHETMELHLQTVSGLPQEVIDHLKNLPPTMKRLPVVAVSSGDTYEFQSAPLMSHGSDIGLLSVRLTGEKPDPDFQALLTSIGQQLGVVLDNAALFEAAVRREALSMGLGRLGLAISAQLDRDTVLRLICHESAGVFDAQGAYIWLVNEKQLEGAAAFGAGAAHFSGHTYPLHDNNLLPSRAIREWHPLFANHVTGTQALTSDFLEMSHAQAALAIPLLKVDIPVGVLLLVNTVNPEAFDSWMIEQIGMLGVQAALAIQNATLFDEIRRRLDQLWLVNAVGRHATAILRVQDLIEGVAEKLFDVLHYNVVGLIQVVNGQLGSHSIFVPSAPEIVGRITEYYISENSIAGQAYREAEPIIQQRPAATSGGQANGENENCALAIPLIIADEVIGVLVVERWGGQCISKDDLDVLEPLAAQFAVSVSNARLFETVRQQTLELEGRVIERTAEIRRQQERTEAILRSVADAVIVFDLNGQVIMTNPVAKDLFDQYDLEMDLGTRIRSLIAHSTLADSKNGNYTEIIALGPVVLQAKAASVVDGDEVRGSVVVLRDISQLRELDRMKDMFVSNVSHELRTPLSNLKLYLSLLQQGRPERHANYMQVMEREMERLARLIGDLLDLSRLQSEQRHERDRVRQPIDVVALISTVVSDNLDRAEKDHKELRYERPPSPLPLMMGDPDQIVRAVTNLVSNAINYTPAGGCIVVRSELSEQINQKSIIIVVSDTGIGIPASDLPTIFDRFHRGSNVESNIPGTGLGLAIIKEIAELHGGSVEVESEENRGSTFRLKFPIVNSRQ